MQDLDAVVGISPTDTAIGNQESPTPGQIDEMEDFMIQASPESRPELSER